MNAGYVRLSRDDDKKNYVSIENQKLIIEQYAASLNMVIDRWYEDDGVSGYILERPAFSLLLKDLNQDIDVLFAKDLSRIGRHNAKVLLFIEDFKPGGKRLILVNDDYDSETSSDDILGIKTWVNEKYVKDTSKKIRRVLGARQKEGTLLAQVPFGYTRNEKKKEEIHIVSIEAEHVKMVYELYLQGMGYRKIASYLNENNISTPSMVRHQREIQENKVTKRQIALNWSDGMIKEILDNDFYTGCYRLHKRARAAIHGSDQRVPKEDQFLFENHHPSIIDKQTFDLVQEIKVKRGLHHYRGCRGEWNSCKIPNPFGSCLFCKDCGSKLTPIVRSTTSRTRKYYICSTYNTKGKSHCPKAHLIEENDLMNDVLTCIRLCRDSLGKIISTYDMNAFDCEKMSIEKKRSELQDSIIFQKSQLKTLLSQKIKDLALSLENEVLINESYDSLQKDILTRIHGLELKLQELNESSLEAKDVNDKLKTALDVVDYIIEYGTLDRKDIEILIEQVLVDENGLPEIQLKYGLSNLISYNPATELNRYENEILFAAMTLIYEDSRNFTSAKYLSAKLTQAGYKKTNLSVLPYIGFMIMQGILKSTEDRLKPYSVNIPKEELNEYIQKFYKLQLTGEEPNNFSIVEKYRNNRNAE